MIPIIISGLILGGLGLIGLYVGIRIARVMREQFEELMPQRMVEYSGFIQFPLGRD